MIGKFILGSTAIGLLLATTIPVYMAPAKAETTKDKLAVSTLKLANGIVLSTSVHGRRSFKWKDVDVILDVLGANAPIKADEYQMAVGNHSTIVWSKYLTTHNGKTWFALNERSQPAAAHSNAIQYEYWVGVLRGSDNYGTVAYCIEGIVYGNLAKAKQEVLSLISNWKVPAHA